MAGCGAWTEEVSFSRSIPAYVLFCLSVKIPPWDWGGGAGGEGGDRLISPKDTVFELMEKLSTACQVIVHFSFLNE